MHFAVYAYRHSIGVRFCDWELRLNIHGRFRIVEALYLNHGLPPFVRRVWTLWKRKEDQHAI